MNAPMMTDAASSCANCQANFPLGAWCQNVEELVRVTQLLEQDESMDSSGKRPMIEQAEGLKQGIVASMQANPSFTQMLEETLEGGPKDQSRGKSAGAASRPEFGASPSHHNQSEALRESEGAMMASTANKIPDLAAVSTSALEEVASVAAAAAEVGDNHEPAVGKYHAVAGEPSQVQRRPGEVQRPWARGDTTLIVRNIPWDVSQDELIEQWPIDGSYNFFFLPYSDFLGRHLGTAIINFVSAEHAARFDAKWAGQKLGRHEYRKALSIAMAETQGRDENLKRVKEDASVLPKVWVGGKLFERHGVVQLVRLAKAEAFGH